MRKVTNVNQLQVGQLITVPIYEYKDVYPFESVVDYIEDEILRVSRGKVDTIFPQTVIHLRTIGEYWLANEDITKVEAWYNPADRLAEVRSKGMRSKISRMCK